MLSRQRNTALRRGAALAVASCIASLVSRGAAAQSAGTVDLPKPRSGFEDSWYWGAKGGLTRFGTVVDGRVSAPLAGAEWLVTHKQGALLVSAEQSFFDKTSLVADANMKDGVRPVRIHDARRYSAAALAAPIAFWHNRVRPYAGLGLALQVIRQATPTGEFATDQQYWTVRDQIDDGQSIVSSFVIGGAQLQVGRGALFVQGHAAGAQTRSLWNLGGQSQVEAGVRFNVASAFEH